MNSSEKMDEIKKKKIRNQMFIPVVPRKSIARFEVFCWSR